MAKQSTKISASENDLARIDRLIDWYVKFNPTAGQSIQVNMKPERLHKLVGVDFTAPAPKSLRYRERTLVAVGC